MKSSSPEDVFMMSVVIVMEKCSCAKIPAKIRARVVNHNFPIRQPPY